MGIYCSLVFKDGRCLVVCSYLWMAVLFTTTNFALVKPFLRKCWFNDIELLKNPCSFQHFQVSRRKLSQHFGGWLEQQCKNIDPANAPVCAQLGRAAVIHECIPLPKFPKAINPSCLFKRKMLFFSRCFYYLVAIGTIQLLNNYWMRLSMIKKK